jgi:hypothetical protein
LAIVHLARADEVVSTGSGTVKKVNFDSPKKEGRSEPKSTAPIEQDTAGENEREAAPDSSASPAFAAIETPEETWEQLVEFIGDKVPSIGSILEHLVCVKIAGDELVIGGKKGEWYMEFLGEREKMVELIKLVSDFFSRREKNRTWLEKSARKPWSIMLLKVPWRSFTERSKVCVCCQARHRMLWRSTEKRRKHEGFGRSDEKSPADEGQPG